MIVGEIRAFAFSPVPAGWLTCDGQNYIAGDYPALAAIIGDTFGGSVGVDFNVPNLQGRSILGIGTSPTGPERIMAESGGVEIWTLAEGEIPEHSHGYRKALDQGTKFTVNAGGQGALTSFLDGEDTGLNAGGGSHENMHPFIVLRFGIYAGT